MKKTGKTLNSSLIKIINVQGIKNIYGFSRGILELHDPSNIYLVFDNDASDDIKEIIRHLNIDENKKYIIGEKEFEDAFSDEILFKCWEQYHKDSERDCPANWETETIKQAREECKVNRGKFSDKLRTLNAGGKKMTKPTFGSVLAQYIEDEHVPPLLSKLIQDLNN